MNEYGLADATLYVYCPCAHTCMKLTRPEPAASFAATTIRCVRCGETPKQVPTAWDQP